MDRSAAQRSREAAFARIGRVRGLTILGAGALSVAIAAAASASAHGHTLGAKTAGNRRLTGATSRSARVSVSALKMPPLATPSQLGLQAPGAPPQSVSPPQATAPAPQTQAPAPSAPPASVTVSGGS
jgi:hypothetical protein